MGPLFRQFDRYSSAIRWLVSRVWRNFKVQLLWVLIGQWLGLAVSAVSGLLLLSLVRKLESGQALEIAGMTIPFADENFLSPAVLMILLTMSLGIILLYLAKRGGVILSGRFNLACASEVAEGYGFFPSSSAAYIDERRLHNEIVRLMNSDSRHAGMALRRLIDAKLATLVLVVGTGILFYLHWLATSLVLLAALFALPFYYRVNQKAAHATKQFEEVMGAGRQDCLRALDQQKHVSTWQQPRLPIDATGFPSFKALVEAHRDRFVALTQSELISRLLAAFAICILVLGLGHFAQGGDIPWFLVLGYLLILRFVMLAIRQINQAFTSISRFYPSLYRLTVYFSATDTALDRESPGLTLNFQRDSIRTRTGRWDLKPGIPTGLCLPVEFSCLSVGLVAKALGSKTPVRQRDLLAQTSLVCGLGIDEGRDEWAGSRESLLSAGMERLSQLTNLRISTLEQLFSEQSDVRAVANDKLSLVSRAKLLLAGALLAERPVVLVNIDFPGVGKAFTLMSEHFGNHIVVLCSCRNPKLEYSTVIAHLCVVAADGSVIAAGEHDWVKDNWISIAVARRRIDKTLLETKASLSLDESLEEE